MSMTKQGSPRKPVVSIKLLGHAAKSQDVAVDEDKLLPGDIVVQVAVGDVTLNAPFAGGKAGLQLELKRLYHVGERQALVKVKRLGNTDASLRGSIVQHDAGMLKKHYALRAVNDANHLVTFVDSSEAESLSIQEGRLALLVSQLAKTQLRDGFVLYPWEKKMKEQEALPQHSNSIFSLLIAPADGEGHLGSSNNLEDTMSRAMTWLTAAQRSGVPIGFLNIQTEPLLTKVSGEEASASSAGTDSMGMNAISKGFYGYEDYHGIDIGVLRAVRLWYFPAVSEVPIVLNLKKGETKLGLGINRMDEGFCYISSVEDGSVAARSALKMILLAAQMAGKYVVISRIGNERITPTMISSSGSIHCYDTASISQKLSLLRLSGQSVTLHVLVGEGTVELASIADATGAEMSATSSHCSSISISRNSNGSSIESLNLISSSNRPVMLRLVSEPGSGRSSSASIALAGLHSSMSVESNFPVQR